MNCLISFLGNCCQTWQGSYEALWQIDFRKFVETPQRPLEGGVGLVADLHTLTEAFWHFCPADTLASF